MKRFLWLGLVLLLYLICTGCGDTFRPIIIPNPPTFPNPAAAHSVVAISDNGTTVAGSVMVIDVSGDTIASVADCTTPLCIGVAPVHAVQQTASQALVVNQSDSLSKVSFSNITNISTTTTITLPANSAPNFVAVAPNQITAYVTLPNYVPDPVNFPDDDAVAVVNTQSTVLLPVIPVGKNPVALAVTPDNTKLYVANYGPLCGNPPLTPCFSVSAFNTVDRSARAITGKVSSPPIWLAARSDSQAVYVLEQNGTLAYISINSTSGADTLTESTISVPKATTMIYDGNQNRLYIPGGQQMAIVDVSQSPPQYLTGAPIPTCDLAPKSTNCIPTAPTSSRGASDPCSLTSTQPLTVVAVAALPDASRAYVGAYYEDSNKNICPQVTAIDATSNITETPSIAISGFPDATIPNLPSGQPDPYYVPVCVNNRFRFMMAAGGDSSRAYLSSCDGGNVSIIDTASGTYLGNLPAPPGSRYNNPPQNPVFLFAGP
jgi:DNA-binding beta-propeller fold protein YncE